LLESDAALLEFRHRVANDLALLGAVMVRRKQQLALFTAGEVLDDAIGSIASLAMLYRQLHDGRRCDDFVDVGEHMERLGARIRHSYLGGLGVDLQVYVPPVEAPHRSVHALGLIVMELVANAARHGRARNIALLLETVGPRWTCAVADDGVGLPNGMRLKDRGGLAYVGRLVDGLNGRMSIIVGNEGGTRVQRCFPAPTTHGGPSLTP
jgi:two-component sensor histidine kinase